MSSKLYTFDQDTHTHRIGGVVVPGITTVLNPLIDFSGVPKNVLEAARLYGSAVHKAIELYCLGCLDLDTLDPAIVPSVEAFDTWLSIYGFNASDFIVEIPMGDPKLMVGCIPDLILDGKLIVEIKTRKPSMLTDSIQTACQEHVWKINGGIKTKEYERRVLYLAPDGTHLYQKVNHRDAMGRFRTLLDHYWTAQKIQSWRNSI